MQSNYDPKTVEEGTYQEWESAGDFVATGNGEAFSIVIPPPNVTGTLHMGHAFQHTLMDALTRHARMSGKQAHWQVGTDHAGIATQMLVERALASEGTNRHEVGRDNFIERVWQWREQSGGTICQQMRRLGSSVDWNEERFTMDEGYSKAVATVFEQLFDEGLIYRGQRLVNWDPVLGTAISDLEVENHDESGHLWHFRYPLIDAKDLAGNDYLVVATTRPETMLGDTAVAVHPEDERYQHLIGQSVRLPLVDRVIPIIADDYVDPEFGTGCVKITPAHDFNDNAMGQRHDLPMINIMNPDASINDEAPPAYQGLDRVEARKRVVADLDELGLLDSIKDHALKVPRGDRSGAIIEPLLTDQWFVKIQPLADPAIKAVEDGDIEFVPKQYENTYFAWMRNIQDWCISRQQWWGHRIPAYYGSDGGIYVGASMDAVREKYGLSNEVELSQDDDVLETWFSSSLWSFASLGWPDDMAKVARFHPTEVLVTGHDIIFFWVARMIMMSLKFMGEIPFRKIYITGLIRDADGNKMSKTKGNGLDPLDMIDGVSLNELIEKRTANLTQPKMAKRIEKATRKEFPDGIPSYGTDALRFTLCALATTGRDVRLEASRVEGYQFFCNKLWNATRFVFGSIGDEPIGTQREDGPTEGWIRTRAAHMLDAVDLAARTYRFDLYASAVYEFIWHEYCDWYVEFAKPILWDESVSEARKNSVRATLLEVLEIALRTAHPIIPFITESLWREVAPRLGIAGRSISHQSFPLASDLITDSASDDAVESLKAIIEAIRTIRGESNIKPGKTLDLLLRGGAPELPRQINATESLLKRLAKIDSITWVNEGDDVPAHALQVVSGLSVMVPLAGAIDVDAELARLAKEIGKLEIEVNKVEGKLNNEKFVAKAPAEVVAKERARAEEYRDKLATLRTQHAELSAA
ncbi:MAG: valine--tRNA ligase [Pseudomonadaceae bacterium]|nr:valine--tRNA ligase [Pseudomonadaceae bacterium]